MSNCYLPVEVAFLWSSEGTTEIFFSLEDVTEFQDYLRTIECEVGSVESIAEPCHNASAVTFADAKEIA